MVHMDSLYQVLIAKPSLTTLDDGPKQRKTVNPIKVGLGLGPITKVPFALPSCPIT